MYIVWGRDLFGSVDKIPGVCVVRTLFPHFMMFPIFPYMTVLVVAGQTPGEPALAVPIRRSWKSVGFAWLRAVSILVCLIALAGTLDQLLNRESYRGTPSAALLPAWATTSAVALAVFLASYPLSRPGPARRDYLLRLVAKIREREAAEQETAEREPPVDLPQPPPWIRPPR